LDDIYDEPFSGLYVINSNPIDKNGTWFSKTGRSKNVVSERVAEYVVHFPYGCPQQHFASGYKQN
jgi:hypothetical protein